MIKEEQVGQVEAGEGEGRKERRGGEGSFMMRLRRGVRMRMRGC